MTTQHEMLGAAVNNSGIPTQQGHQVPTHNPNMQQAGRAQWFGTTAQQNYNQMHGTVQEPVVQQPQQVQQAPQWSQAPQYQYQQPAQPVQQQAPVQPQQPVQAPVEQPPVQQPVEDQQPETVPAPEEAIEVSEEEKQKLKEESEQKKEELKEDAEDKTDVNSYYEKLLEKLIDEGEQWKVETLQARKESEFFQTKVNELTQELNELKYNSNAVAMHEQWRGLAMTANNYYGNPEDAGLKEKYIGKILNTLGELTGVNAFDMFNKYSQWGKRVVSGMSGSTGASAQDPNAIGQQPYKPQGVVRKAGNRTRRRWTRF